ncbi:Aste57867_15231 [Aphanomyces stellatus]|uniref:Aste57867_15231 protein n=1 Tax=Aphanomyces stellatus TaxID=120398 RepID=A0A485L2N8_9STRA|nr:hypothetical protein As57867_015175 [Aphanomyces stellatus]VFT92040.1 Aste57867_15231 [Aphanomyces stellatus]
MLKLMMLSVLKRTNNPVTFWLLENFLSPDFKNSVPVLQAEFGMDIRLITYKWPNWLRRQTEKQRIIWGYKILFLDVLFPLGVEKIIYVDADQVVRADLNELWTMDLQGKAYGYTPFCDSRNVGFQFWRQGYWKDHLRGRPYHISALYVVDLKIVIFIPGHLYERMLKLMMLSVLKRTNNPVTFWLLENFLSPDFKNSVPVLQAEFGMDIRLITYKWPNWLRRQTEKQHIWRRNQLGQNYSYYINC